MGVVEDLVEACAPRQENVAIVATTPFGGGAFSKKYMYDRSVYDRVRGTVICFCRTIDDV